jgi:hypothetical protein
MTLTVHAAKAVARMLGRRFEKMTEDILEKINSDSEAEEELQTQL